MPYQVLAAGCGGFNQYVDKGPDSCRRNVTVTGLVFEQGHRPAVWQGFACDVHASELIAPRRLLPRDRARLMRRQDKRSTLMDGRRWEGEDEGPVAVGSAAERLVERARAWAEAHPLDQGDQAGASRSAESRPRPQSRHE